MRKFISMVVLIAMVFTLSTSFKFAGSKAQGEFTYGHYFSWLNAAPQPDSIINKWLGDKTGVWFKEARFPNSGDPIQKLTLEISTNDLPDLLLLGDEPSWLKLISLKKVITLDKYFNDPANYPNLAKLDKKIVDLFKYKDGHIYKIPIGHSYSIPFPTQWGAVLWGRTAFWVQSSLLKQAKMKSSDLATIDGIEKFLKIAVTLKDDKGQNYLPLGWDPGANWKGYMEGIFGVNALSPDKNGLNPDIYQPGFLKMTSWLSKMNRQGLIDKDAYSQNADLYRGKLKAGRYAITLGHSGTIYTDTEEAYLINKYGNENFRNHINPEGWMTLPVVKVPGIQPKPIDYVYVAGTGGKGIASSCKNPDKLMKLIDYLYSKEGLVVANWNTPDAGIKLNNKGQYIIDSVYNAEYWNKFPSSVNNIGLWFWQFGGMQLTFNGSTVNGKKYINDPAGGESAGRRKFIYGALDMFKKGLVAPTPAWMMFTNRDKGAYVKYSATVTDINNKYIVEMIRAKDDESMMSVFSDYKKELENRAHYSELLAEQFQDYRDYLKTPAGKTATTLKFSTKMLDDMIRFRMPIEKNVPNTYYGDFSELLYSPK